MNKSLTIRADLIGNQFSDSSKVVQERVEYHAIGAHFVQFGPSYLKSVGKTCVIWTFCQQMTRSHCLMIVALTCKLKKSCSRIWAWLFFGGHPFVSRVLCAPGSIRPCRKVMIKGFYVWVLSEILAVICSNVTALMTPRLCSKIRDNGNQKSKDDIVSMKQDNVFYSSQSQQHLIHISSRMCTNSSRKILRNENDLRH